MLQHCLIYKCSFLICLFFLRFWVYCKLLALSLFVFVGVHIPNGCTEGLACITNENTLPTHVCGSGTSVKFKMEYTFKHCLLMWIITSEKNTTRGWEWNLSSLRNTVLNTQ